MSRRSHRNRNFYDILQVERGAGNREIRRAYRNRVREHHPDFSGSTDASEFLEIQQAYETLSDPSSREAYDHSLEGSVPIHVGGAEPPREPREITIEEAFSSGFSGYRTRDWDYRFGSMEREEEIFQEMERLLARFFRRF